MALIGCKDPVYDRQVDKIFEMIEKGITKEEIAKELGYKNSVSVDNYMRRRNFSWDSKARNFVSAAMRYSAASSSKQLQLHGVSKTDYVTAMFDQGEADPKEIAQRIGFDTHKELAAFMKSKGYVWSSEQGNYVKNDGSIQKNAAFENPELEEKSLAEALNSIIPLIRNIQQEEIKGVLDKNISKPESNEMPRYFVKGMYCCKAMRMANAINELVCNYSEERNITQREIVEVALIEFFSKYGYKDKVQDCIHN
jgi:hypothetical protein